MIHSARSIFCYLLILFLLLIPSNFAQSRDWSVDAGMRAWFSSGTTRWSHFDNTSSSGDPTSRLTYDGTDAYAGELTMRGNHASSLFFKGYVGLGTGDGGTLRDQDWLAGPVEISDTDSDIETTDIQYASLDVGINAVGYGRTGWFLLSPYTGVHWYEETIEAFGAVKNPDDLDPSSGQILVSRDVKAITNEVTWVSWRTGFEANAHLTEGLVVKGDFSFVPVSVLRNEDSHHLRTSDSDLGPTPNILHEGVGRGAMIDLSIDYRVSDRFRLGLGYRWWRLDVDSGDVKFGPDSNNPSDDLPLRNFESKRSGLLLTGTYEF